MHVFSHNLCKVTYYQPIEWKHTVTLHDIICKTAFPRYADKIICHLCQHVYGYSVFTCNSILKLGTSPGKSLRHVQSRTISRHQAGMQALLYENVGCVIRQRFVHFYFLSKGSNCRIIGQGRDSQSVVPAPTGNYANKKCINKWLKFKVKS